MLLWDNKFIILQLSTDFYSLYKVTVEILLNRHVPIYQVQTLFRTVMQKESIRHCLGLIPTNRRKVHYTLYNNKFRSWYNKEICATIKPRECIIFKLQKVFSPTVIFSFLHVLSMYHVSVRLVGELLYL